MEKRQALLVYRDAPPSVTGLRSDVYLASEVDARIADATARIGRQEARVMYLERRLFECESAMLMAHDAGRAKYMNEYPEPIEAPSPY